MRSCCQGGYQDGVNDDCYHHDHHRDHGYFHNFSRPYVLVASIPRNRQTGVSPNIKAIKLIFARDYTTRGLIDVENVIDMWQGLNRIPISIRRTVDKKTGRRVLLVIPLIPLVGGVTYKVRVRSVLIFRDGTKVPKCRLIVFSTGCR